MNLHWVEATRTGQSVECFRDAGGDNGDGWLAGQVIRYGDGRWHAYAHRRKVGGDYATAKDAQAAVEAHLATSRR